MGFRVIILAAMGLGALYMMHLLAQDYDRIRRPITKAIERALRGKRHTDAMDTSNELDLIHVDWKSVLKRDPFGCLQSLICQLMSGAQTDNDEAIMFIRLLELTLQDAPVAIKTAYARGLAYKRVAERCYMDYPFCWYSARTMLKLLHWFT